MATWQIYDVSDTGITGFAELFIQGEAGRTLSAPGPPVNRFRAPRGKEIYVTFFATLGPQREV